MFDQTQKKLALDFANALADRDYVRAYSMLGADTQTQMTVEDLREEFEAMIPLDWGEVDPIQLEENPAWDELFIYVVLGGEVYSEAIMITAFTSEQGATKIQAFDFGRP